MNAGMHLFLYLLLFYDNSNAAGLNVCKRKQSDSRNNPVIIYYCCLGYKERDHKCTAECSSGFFAVNGTCVPCTENFFGDRCLELCSCSAQQRCDPVIGCVDMTTVYQKESTVTMDFWKLLTSYLTSKEALRKYSTTYLTTKDIIIQTEEPSETDKGNTSSNGPLHLKVSTLLYIGVSILVTFMLIIFFVIYIFQRKHINLFLSDGNTSGTNQNNGNPNVELMEHLYHTINDEDILVDTNTNNVSFQNDESESSTSLRDSDPSCYLEPYCSENTLEQANDLPANDRNNIEPLCISSEVDSSLSEIPDDNFDDTSDYLHPYCSLHSAEADSRTYSEVKSDINLPEFSCKEHGLSKQSDKFGYDCDLLKPVVDRRIAATQNVEKDNEKDNTYVNTIL